MDSVTIAPDTGRSLFGHPRGLAFLAFTEAWERFSFSGMQTLLVLYMVGQLLQPGHIEHVAGFSGFQHQLEHVYGPLSAQPLSSVIFGLYTGFIFLMPVFGGMLGDRVFGQHRMVMAGAVLMAAGQFLMMFDSPFLLALLLLILGCGCLKGNISTQVGGLYADGDRRRTDAFQIFSIGINTGVILAPLICGTLGEIYGWRYGFAAAGVGMLIGLVIYIAGQRDLPPDRLRLRTHETVTARSRLEGRMVYEKDMDFYAAEGNYVAPLPFLSMGEYPYPANKSFPLDDAHLNYLLEYNTRHMSGNEQRGYWFDYGDRR